MKRMEKRGIIAKKAFISGARDAKYGLKNHQIEIQRKLEEIEKLEIANEDVFKLEKVQQLNNEIVAMREAYTAGGEMAMLHPNKDYYELLSEYLGGSESKEDLQQEMEQSFLEERQSKKEKRTIKKPQVPLATKRHYSETEKEELKEKLKGVGAVITLIAMARFINYVEENSKKNNDIERNLNSNIAQKQETMDDKYSEFRKRINENSGEYTQSDGITYTYNIPQNYIDRNDGR